MAKISQIIVPDMTSVTKIPNSKDFYLGAILFRDEATPLLSLKRYFGYSDSESSGVKLAVVCELNGCRVALLVDRIQDILRCSWNDYRQDSSNGATDNSSITGTVVCDGEITPIIDLEEIVEQVTPNSGINRDLLLDRVPKGDSDLKEKKIVFCEDSTTVQRALVQALNQSGLSNIKVFSNGKDGLEFISSGAGVDLIITDIEMPTMDGLTLCKKVREINSLKSIPVVFFSSTITEEMREKCISVGGSGAFTKPEIAAMTQEISRLLK